MLTRRRLLGSLLGGLAAALVPTAWKPSASVHPVVIRDYVAADRVAGLIEARWIGPVEGTTAVWWQYGKLIDMPGVEHPPDGWYHCVITDDGRGQRTYYLNGQARPDVVFPVPTPDGAPVFAEFDRVLDAVTVQRFAELR